MLDTIGLSIDGGIYLNLRPISQSHSEANFKHDFVACESSHNLDTAICVCSVFLSLVRMFALRANGVNAVEDVCKHCLFEFQY